MIGKRRLQLVKTRIVLPVMYGVFFIAALVWMFAHAKQTAFCGIFAVLLTIPWSLLVTPIIERISPGLFDSSMLPGTLVLVFCALLNAGILFLAGAADDGCWRGKSS